MKEKILFIGRFPPPTHGASLMNELYFNGKNINKKFDLRRIKINRYGLIEKMGKLNLKKFLGTFKIFFELLKNLISFKPHLIYFEIAPKGIAFFRDSLFALLCKIFKKKIIFQIHARGLKQSNYAKFIFKNNKIIILSEKLYNEVLNIFDKKDIYIIPNGIKNQLNDKKLEEILKVRLRNKKSILLFLSNMMESKGPIDVLKICNELKRNGFRFECLFIGAFPDKNIENKWFSYRKKYNLEKECKHLGSKYGREKNKIFKKINFFIFPTRYENESFPLVILESFMFGIPVLSYDNGAIKEIISKNYLGKIFEKGDWKAMAKELEDRIHKKQNYKKIRQYFKKNYIFEIAEKRLIKIFRENLK